MDIFLDLLFSLSKSKCSLTIEMFQVSEEVVYDAYHMCTY